MGWNGEKNQVRALALIITVSAPVSVSAKANTCWLRLIHACSKKLCIGLILLWRLLLKYIVCLSTSLVHFIYLCKSIYGAWNIIVYIEEIVDCVMFKRKYLFLWKLHGTFEHCPVSKSMYLSPNLDFGVWLIHCLSLLKKSVRTIAFLAGQQCYSHMVAKPSHQTQGEKWVLWSMTSSLLA